MADNHQCFYSLRRFSYLCKYVHSLFFRNGRITAPGIKAILGDLSHRRHNRQPVFYCSRTNYRRPVCVRYRGFRGCFRVGWRIGGAEATDEGNDFSGARAYAAVGGDSRRLCAAVIYQRDCMAGPPGRFTTRCTRWIFLPPAKVLATIQRQLLLIIIC